MSRDDDILLAFAAGKSLRAIGAEFGISGERVRQIVAKAGKSGSRPPKVAKPPKPANPYGRWGKAPSELTLRRVATLREMSSLGIWKARAASILGVEPFLISQISLRHSISFPRKPALSKRESCGPERTLSPMRKLIALRYSEGASPSEIAVELGKTTKHIMVVASQMGITKGNTDAAKYRRGFVVPDHLRDLYLELGRKKNLSKQTRARVLGLIASEEHQ